MTPYTSRPSTYNMINDCLMDVRMYFSLDVCVRNRVRQIYSEVRMDNVYWATRTGVRALIGYMPEDGE